MKTLMWVVLLALAGCAARDLKVNCEGKLQPINAPAKAVP